MLKAVNIVQIALSKINFVFMLEISNLDNRKNKFTQCFTDIKPENAQCHYK